MTNEEAQFINILFLLGIVVVIIVVELLTEKFK